MWGGTKMRRAFSLGVLLLGAMVVFVGQSAYAQFADRAVITGIVTDSSGSAIPDAKVTIIDENTGAKIVTLASGMADPLERSEDHTSELQSPCNLVCRLLLE